LAALTGVLLAHTYVSRLLEQVVPGFFVPLSPPEMNCLENDDTNQYAAA
jgi:hypothetical protein